jgi:hypothetical protein
MDDQLAHLDVELILTSLEFKQMKCDNTQYESYEVRQRALEHVTNVRAKVRALLSEFLLTCSDLDLIIESLEDTKLNFERYDYYPNPELKQSQLERVSTAIAKIRALQTDGCQGAEIVISL